MVSDTYCSESCWAWWMLGESRWIWFLPPEAYKFDEGLIIKYLCVVVIVVLILQKKKCAKSAYFLSQSLHLMACVRTVISGEGWLPMGMWGQTLPACIPDSPLPLLAWTSFLQLELSVLLSTYFLSYHSSQACLCPQTLCLSKCSWGVGMKGSRTWRKIHGWSSSFIFR